MSSEINGTIIIIDYDKSEITWFDQSLLFQMNDKGFISKIREYNKNIDYPNIFDYIYDSDNHLVEIREHYKGGDSIIAKQIYDYIGGNLVRWKKHDPRRNPITSTYTYGYGDDDNIGNYIHLLNDKYHEGWSLGFDEPGYGHYLDIILYQSGLFGKVSKKLMTNKSGKWHDLSIEYTFDEDHYIKTVIEKNIKKKDESSKTFYFVYE